MLRAFRIAYAFLAWAVVVGLVAQVFFIGLALFGEQSTELHIVFGWILHLVPLLVVLFAALSRAGRSHWLWALAMAVVVFLVPIFATMRNASVVAALHPVAAMLGFALAVVVAWKSLAALRAPVSTQPVTPTTGPQGTRP